MNSIKLLTLTFCCLLVADIAAQNAPAAFAFETGCTRPSTLGNEGANFFVIPTIDMMDDAVVGQDWMAVRNTSGAIIGRAVVSEFNNGAITGANIITRVSYSGTGTCSSIADDNMLTVLFFDASSNTVLTGPSFSAVVTNGRVNGPDNMPTVPDEIDFSTSSLPVTLVDFTASPAAGQVNLTWSTSEETDNSYFDVQRSTNPERGFETIGKVRGNETTSDLSTYAYEDRSASAGTNYYRLEQFDFDGTSTYSPVVIAEVLAAPELGLSVFPNPAVANGRLSLNLSGEWAKGTTVRMSDASGRQVKTWANLAAGSVNVETPALRAGVYQLTAVNGKESRTTRVVIR